MDYEYHQELDETKLCPPEVISKYRSLIGSANWIITLGHFDILFATNLLARYCSAPRMGHYYAAQCIFGYLMMKPNGKILIDTGPAPIREEVTPITDHDWHEMYPDACEDIPDKVPTPKGNTVDVLILLDSDHARDKLTRQSVSG